MNGKKAKAIRRQARESAPPVKASRIWTSWKGGLIVLGVVAVIAASFVLPSVLNKKTTSTGAQHAMAMGAKQGAGLPVGSPVPSFSERDLLSGKTITSRSLFGHKALLFFSEGVMCQACFQQIQGLEQFGAELHQRGIELVSVTPDPPSDLEQAAGQYGITTPLISDSDLNMSEAFNTLGRGMHADTPGHAFALIDHGKVLWYRDYWLPPYRAMYVEPQKLLAEIPDA
jgi:peroxiredoxin